ncbi:MAG: ABC transporter substrate-binding protein [Bacillota bacterium]|nr:ABC transporter substrate-binding protein [Bacillota bacterium]
MYDTLIAPDGTKFVPVLAESWKTSPDGKVYTFTLRKDVQFHSGKKMTSKDVKWSFERLANPKTASPWSGLVSSIEKVETPDDYTVVLQLKAPDRLLLSMLAQPGASILNQEAVEKAGKEYGRTVVDGTGPFKLVSRKFNEEIVYERFANYKWGPSIYQNKGPARVKRLIWKVTPELQARQLMMEAGEIDTITHHIDPSLLLKKDSLKGKADITTRPVTHTRAVTINVTYPKLTDVAVRRAIAHAVPSKSIAETIYAPVGSRALNLLHPTVFGYFKGIESLTPAYDLEKAKKTLDDAGWKLNANGVRQKGNVILDGIPVMGLPQYEPIAVLIQENLGKIGIKAKVEMLERGKLYPMRRTGDVPIEVTNTTGVPDRLYHYLHSATVGGSNLFFWKDAETDKKIATFLSDPDENKALQAAYDLQKLAVVDQCMFIPIYWIDEINEVNTRTVHDFVGSTWVNSGIGKLLDAWSTRK